MTTAPASAVNVKTLSRYDEHDLPALLRQFDDGRAPSMAEAWEIMEALAGSPYLLKVGVERDTHGWAAHCSFHSSAERGPFHSCVASSSLVYIKHIATDAADAILLMARDALAAYTASQAALAQKIKASRAQAQAERERLGVH